MLRPHSAQTHPTLRVGGFAYFFALFFVMIVLPLSIAGGAFAVKIYRESIVNVQSAASEHLESVSSYVESALSDISRTASQYVNSPWVNEITYMQGNTISAARVDSRDLSDYTQHLRIASMGSGLTDVMAIVFTSKDYVISSDGIASGNVFFDMLYRTDIAYSNIHDITSSPCNLTVTGSYNRYVGNSLIDNGCTLIFTQKLLTNYMGDTIFCAFIPVKAIRTQIERKYAPDPFSLIISTKDDLTLLEFGNAAGEALTYSGHYLDYRIYIPSYAYSRMLNPILRIAIAAAILLLLLTTLVSWLLSSRQVQHVLKLERLMLDNSQSISEESKFHVNYQAIEDMIRQLSDSHDSALRSNELQKPLAINQLLLRIVTGDNADMLSAKEALQSYGICLDKRCYMIIQLSTDKPEISNSIQAIASELTALWDGPVALSVYVPGSGSILLINCSADDSSDSLAARVDEFLACKYGSDYGTLMFSGIYCDSANSAFQEWQKFNSCRFTIGQRDSRTYSFARAELESTAFYYPTVDEERLLAALEAGDSGLTHSILSDIFKHNSELNWICANQLHLLLFSLIYTARCALDNNNVAQRLHVDFSQVQGIGSIDCAHQYACELYDKVMLMIQSARSISQQQFGIEILKFVDENYHHPEMSLTMLAAETGKPEYVLSREFKRTCGCGFAEYVQCKRVEEAKQLIAKGHSIKGLAEQLGFGSDITFRRTFKKVSGMTPSEYKLSVWP